MSAPLKVFCCYARKDQEMLAQLKTHLAPLVRGDQIMIWSDANLNAGIEWEKELQLHLESADIILLLISPDFMASDYCYSKEMERAIRLQREGMARIIPILLRSCIWQSAPFAKLQVVPTDAKPVTSWPDRDDAWHNVTVWIQQIVDELREKARKEAIKNNSGQQQRRAWRPKPTPESAQNLPTDYIVFDKDDVEPSEIAEKGIYHAFSPKDTMPMVSCIMPTNNRCGFVQQSLTYFEQQDYPNKELIIVDDGDDQTADLVLSRPYVRYEHLSQKAPVGVKRNLACELAQGSIIAHWDDDDWYASHRLSYQIIPLLRNQADITGLEVPCFFDILRWQAWSCSSILHKQLFLGNVHGSTLVYHRFVWDHLAKYPAVSIGEDAFFLRSAYYARARLVRLPHSQSFVYIRHGHNTWKLSFDSPEWNLTDLPTYLSEKDFAFYSRLRNNIA